MTQQFHMYVALAEDSVGFPIPKSGGSQLLVCLSPSASNTSGLHIHIPPHRYVQIIKTLKNKT